MTTEVGVARRARPGLHIATVRVIAMAGLVIALASLHLRRPATVCPLRATTGIPCPFCGGTTAAVALGHADLRAALSASPLAVAMIAALPFVGIVRPPRWWRTRWLRLTLIAATLVVAEAWQLLRLGVVAV